MDHPDNTTPSGQVPANGREPNENSWLTTWASVPNFRYKALAELALTEQWHYGSQPCAEQDEYPILKNYLLYTFKRLCYENKVLIRVDPERNE